MKPLADKIRKIFSLLLVVHVAVAFALPAGTHLNICIGPDENVVVKLEACFQSSSPTSASNEALSGQRHHNDCTDVEIGCTPSEGIRLAITDISSLRAGQKKRGLSGSTGEEILYIPFSTDTYSIPVTYHLFDESISSFHLPFVRTSVLLI